MYLTVPIKIIIEDNPHNPPEAGRLATTFVMKVPRFCPLHIIKDKIYRKYPAMENLASAIYFQGDGGSDLTLFNHRIEAFWSYQTKITDETISLHVSVMNFKHPTMVCHNCDKDIFGVIFTCSKCRRHCACITCINNGRAGCFVHGTDFFFSTPILMTENMFDRYLAQQENQTSMPD